MDMTPWGRGFDTSLHYFAGAVDHFTSCNCVENMCSAPNNAYSNMRNNTPGNHCGGYVSNPNGPAGTVPLTPESDHLQYAGVGATDLWCTSQPCYGINGTAFNDKIFTDEAIRLIEAHDTSVPFFMYIAFQLNHAPLQVPAGYMERYPEGQYWDQHIMNGMSSYWDEAIGNITDTMKRVGMWENTLWVMSGDNGGPVYWTDLGPIYAHGGSANNFPLKGKCAHRPSLMDFHHFFHTALLLSHNQ